MMIRLVVTGTDTGVGKTVFAAGLATLAGVPYWKPIQSGLADGEDAEAARRLGVRTIRPSAYRLVAPLSPHRAAELDHVVIDPARLQPPEGPLVIEGAGGALVPVTRTLLFADLFARWRLPVVLVARTALGTINHSLLSLEALRSRGLAIQGIAFVGDANEDSERTIAAMGGVRRLGRLPFLSPLAPAPLRAAMDASFTLAEFEA